MFKIFLENRVFYEIMWKNTVETEKPHIWRMRIAWNNYGYKHTP